MPRYESLEKRMNLPRKKPRYGRKQLVDSGTRDRTISRYNRLKAMGINPGVSQGQLDTGAGARAVRQALRSARAGKSPATTEPVRRKRKPSYGGGAAAPVARVAAEDDYPRAFTPGVRQFVNKWQTRRRGRMHGTVPMR